jgi:plastocyanin
MTRMRSILLGAGTSLVLVLTACSSGSSPVAGNSSRGARSGSSSPAVASSSPGGASSGSSSPAVASSSSAGGSGGGSSAVAGKSSRGGSFGGGPGVVEVRSGTAATSVKETDYLKFVPASVTVKVGDIVVFTNGGTIPHNVTFPYAGIGSPTMKGGSSFFVKFTSPGTYPYVCTLHFSGMLGTITVR